jgi:hypothetical protein
VSNVRNAPTLVELYPGIVEQQVLELGSLDVAAYMREDEKAWGISKGAMFIWTSVGKQAADLEPSMYMKIS